MASQATKNEQKWSDYCQRLAKAGLAPTKSVARGYAQASQFWNTVDTEAVNDFENAMRGQDAK